MAHEVVPVITGQHRLPLALVGCVHRGFKQVKIGLLSIAANDQTTRYGAVALMIHIVFMARATRGNEGWACQYIISWHESHLTGDVVAGADKHELFGLRQSKADEKDSSCSRTAACHHRWSSPEKEPCPAATAH